MLAVLLVLLLLALLFGFGFTLHALWFVALAVLVLALLGFFVRGGRTYW